MNRLILILVLLFGTQINAEAQNNQVEAKAAYLLAEESFANGDYELTLKYLDNATRKLGKANSKLLYLQIQAELELYKKDRSYYDQIINTIYAFQNSPDVNSFTEEKVLEIAKLKMQIADEHNMQLEQGKRAKEEKERYTNNFRHFTFENWPIGASFSELKLSHQDSAIFKEKNKSRNIYKNNKKSGRVEHIRGNFINDVAPRLNLEWGSNFVLSIITEGDIVKGYKKIIYNQYIAHYRSKALSNSNKTFAEAKNDIQEIIKGLSRDFGFNPEVSKNGLTYSWVKGNKAVILYDDSDTDNRSGSKWQSRAVLEISEM